MPIASSRTRGPEVPPFSRELLEVVASAAETYFAAGAEPLPESVRASLEIFERVFDACADRGDLERLDSLADGRLTAWIPDVAIALGRLGRTEEGAVLLARLAGSLGFEPFPSRLLVGMIEGVGRWGGWRDCFEINIPTTRLAQLVADLITECPTPARLEELSVLLCRWVPDWHDHAAELLADAGPVPLQNGTHFITLPAAGRRTGADLATLVNRLRVGRNDPCPCGSGKKHKKCCGSGQGCA
jgi:hypothetical protein